MSISKRMQKAINEDIKRNNVVVESNLVQHKFDWITGSSVEVKLRLKQMARKNG